MSEIKEGSVKKSSDRRMSGLESEVSAALQMVKPMIQSDARLRLPYLAVLAVGFSTSVIFPFNAVFPTTYWIVAITVVTLAGLAGLASVCREGPTGRRLVLACLTPALATAIISAPRVPQVVLLGLCFIVGYCITRKSRLEGIRWLLVLLISIHAMVLVFEYVEDASVLTIIGLPLRVDYSAGLIARAQGVMGHPLVSAYVLAGLAGILILVWQPRGSIVAAALSLIVIGLASLSTGTRSVLILGGLAIVFLLLQQAVSDNLSHIARTIYLWMILAIFAAALLLSNWQSAQDLRVFRFENLASENSFEVRSRVLTVLDKAESGTDCGLLCQVFGHGYRASTDYLIVHPPAPLVATFDNIVVTLWFDFRVIGLAILLTLIATLIHAIRDRLGVREVAIFGLLGVMPGAFFDSLYSPAMVGIVGSMCGLLLSRSPSNSSNGVQSKLATR